MKKLFFLLFVVLMAGCGKDASNEGGSNFPVGLPKEDGSVVRGRAEVQVGASQSTAMLKLFYKLIPYAYAATGTTTVTYTNAERVNFTINTTLFGASGFTSDTLNLGSISISSIDDNKLKVCGINGNQKCNLAIIRVYTIGTIEGFVNTADQYGVPVYAGSLNPSMPVGLNSNGSVQVQTVNISNKNRLRLNDFPTPSYEVKSDFSNAGSGDYSMNFVVEYVLSL